MKGRIVRYILILVLLLSLSVILFRKHTPFGQSNSSFASKPKKEITAIEFSLKSKKLKLSKENDEWLLNGKHETRKSSISFIKQILTEIAIKSPVSQELFNQEIVDKKIEPVKVRVFEKKKLLKSFYVYKTRSNIYGNIMKMREGSKPFIVYIPGYETDIGSAFNVNELYWQPFTVFNLLPSEISEISLVNFSDTSASFSIKREKGGFCLSDLENYLSGWDSSRIERYISYFVHVPFESWCFELSDWEKEKLKARKPLYKIRVTRINGDKINLTLWERTINDSGTEKTDTDRLFAKTDANEELFIIRYLDIDPLLKKRSYFFP